MSDHDTSKPALDQDNSEPPRGDKGERGISANNQTRGKAATMTDPNHMMFPTHMIYPRNEFLPLLNVIALLFAIWMGRLVWKKLSNTSKPLRVATSTFAIDLSIGIVRCMGTFLAPWP